MTPCWHNDTEHTIHHLTNFWQIRENMNEEMKKDCDNRSHIKKDHLKTFVSHPQRQFG